MQHADDRCRGFLHATVDRRRPATGLVPDDKQPGRLREGDGGGFSIKKEGTPASFRLLQRLIDYGIATGYLRGRTVQRTSG